MSGTLPGVGGDRIPRTAAAGGWSGVIRSTVRRNRAGRRGYRGRVTLRKVHWRDDAEALTAMLRLAAVPVLIIGERFVPKPEPTETGFLVAIVGFSLYAVGALVLLLLRPPSRMRAPLLAAVDVAFAGILSFTSGGGFSQLRFAFLFAPVTAAFRCRPAFTASVSGAAIVVYALQALSHPSHSSRSNSLSFVIVQVVYLAWLGAGLTLLSLLLERRERAVGELSAARQWLVAEALAAEERERQRLAEDLHDNAIQNLLAARHELHDRADADPSGSDALALAAMTATIQQLRTSISDLHPLLLDTLGLEAALSQTARRAAERGGFDLDLRLDELPAGLHDRMLLRCASELLQNVVKHAEARNVEVSLRARAGLVTLRVVDDGIGFDPAIVGARLQHGHIGLLSVRERVAALGGVLRTESAPDQGTAVTLSLPWRPVRPTNGARPSGGEPSP
jgi:two-component system NarL family sensor kinase